MYYFSRLSLLTILIAHFVMSAALANDCSIYLSGRNAKDGIESTSSLIRGKNHDFSIDWNYVISLPSLEAFVAQLPGTSSFVVPSSLLKFKDAGFSVRKLDSPICPECFHELASQAGGRVWVPISSANGTSLLTIFFTAQFKPGISIEEIRDFNQLNGVTIVQSIPVGKNVFKLKVSSTEEVTAIDMANLYSHSGKTIFAEPEFGNVFPPRSE